MANESVPQSETPNPHINEMMVCQMRSAIRELWPDEFDVKPKLTVIQGGRVS